MAGQVKGKEVSSEAPSNASRRSPRDARDIPAGVVMVKPCKYVYVHFKCEG